MSPVMIEVGKPKLIVDFLRHGNSAYTEEGRDLTVKGEEEIRNAAQNLLRDFNSKKITVLLWSSPAARAKGSIDIILDEFSKAKIRTTKVEIIPELRPFDIRNWEQAHILFQRTHETNRSFDFVQARDSIFTQPSQDFESRPEIAERIGTIFSRLETMTWNSDGHPIHIIAATHFEILNPIVEINWNATVEKNEGIHHGEILRLIFQYNSSSDEMSISGLFRGEVKDRIILEDKSRKIRRNP